MIMFSGKIDFVCINRKLSGQSQCVNLMVFVLLCLVLLEFVCSEIICLQCNSNLSIAKKCVMFPSSVLLQCYVPILFVLKH